MKPLLTALNLRVIVRDSSIAARTFAQGDSLPVIPGPLLHAIVEPVSARDQMPLSVAAGLVLYEGMFRSGVVVPELFSPGPVDEVLMCLKTSASAGAVYVSKNLTPLVRDVAVVSGEPYDKLVFTSRAR